MSNNINDKLRQLLGFEGEAAPDPREILEAIKKYVKTKPEQAAIIAALGGISLGLLLGHLLRRK